jgi:hypothetical protein
MNKTTDTTQTTQATATEEPAEAHLGPENPKAREYARNVEETNLSLMLHNPRLFSELSHYFKSELFADKPTGQLWKLMSRGKVEEFALQEAINRSKFDEPASVLGKSDPVALD